MHEVSRDLPSSLPHFSFNGCYSDVYFVEECIANMFMHILICLALAIRLFKNRSQSISYFIYLNA